MADLSDSATGLVDEVVDWGLADIEGELPAIVIGEDSASRARNDFGCSLLSLSLLPDELLLYAYV